MRDIQLPGGVAGSAAAHAAGDDLDTAAGLVYECLLPALPGSVSRVRRELAAALAERQVRAERRADIELVFTEAAHNAVVHAYRGRGAGPLFVAASLAGDAVIMWVSDGGRGIRPSSGGPGAGLGVPLMKQLADDLRICCDAVVGGTCVQATFQRAAYPALRAAASRERERAVLLSEYLRVLGEVSASLRDDSQAVLAQATQAVAHARRRQRERARERR